MNDLPAIAITMGDPAGIGPEIIVKALSDKEIFKFSRPVVLGDSRVLSSTISKMCQDISLHETTSPSEAVAMPGRINLLAISDLKGQTEFAGKPTIEGGNAMVEYVVRAADMCMKGFVGAMDMPARRLLLVDISEGEVATAIGSLDSITFFFGSLGNFLAGYTWYWGHWVPFVIGCVINTIGIIPLLKTELL